MYNEKEAAIAAIGSTMPFISSYLRNAVSDQVSIIMRRTAGKESLHPDLDKQLVLQSTYCLMRLMGNLTMAEALATNTPYLRRNGDMVRWLEDIYYKAKGLFATKNVALHFHTDLRQKVMGFNGEKLEVAIYHLLNNALKFTDEGGSVTMTLRQGQGRVLISVADNGCGVDEEMAPIIFERFLHSQRTDPPCYGLGLGLPVSRQIVQRHGGGLLLDSREGEGTTVTISLPDDRLDKDELGECRFDYLGGFSHAHINLSDALPMEAFTEAYLDL